MMRTVIASTVLLSVAAEYQYFCKHSEDKYSHYINCDECIDEPICCDVSEAAVGYRPNGGGKRCTKKAHGFADVSNCASLTYPAACSGGSDSEEEPPAVGGAQDENGCYGTAGYAWCATESKCMRLWEETALLDADGDGEVTGAEFEAHCTAEEEPPAVGGAQDENGCYSSAGYLWCATESQCMRQWEQAEKMDANGDGEVTGEEFEAHCTDTTDEGNCECANPPCAEDMCSISCEHGILVDEDGCTTCTCAEGPEEPEPEEPVPEEPVPEEPVPEEPVPEEPVPEEPVEEVCSPGLQNKDTVCSGLSKIGKFETVELCAKAVMEQCDYVDNFNYRPRNGACLCSNTKCATKANSLDIDVWGCGYAQQFGTAGVRSASGKEMQKGTPITESKGFPIALAIGVGAIALVAIIAASIVVYQRQQSKSGLHVLQNKAEDINDTTAVAEDEELVEEGTAVVINC